MQFILDDQQMPAFSVKNNYPEEFKAQSGITDNLQKINSASGQDFTTYRDIYFEGVRIFYHQRQMNRNISIHTTIDYPYLQLFFWLKGGGGNRPAGHNHTFFAEERQHYINYSPGFEGNYYLNGDREKVELLQIHLTEDFFKHLIHENNKQLYELAESYSLGKPYRLAKPFMYITPHMNAIIEEIVHYPTAGKYKSLFMESKVLDLLFLQLRQIDEAFDPAYSLSKSTIEKLHHARSLLENQFLDPPSSTELAQFICLNTFKLKKGFKALFNKTVFEYVNDIRMEYGKQLILSSDITISEIAYKLGYSFPHHFSNAFKKKFGYLPGQLKKKGSHYLNIQ